MSYVEINAFDRARACWERDHGTSGLLDWTDLMALPEPIHWIVTCRDHDPDSEGGGYWISLDRIRTWREVAEWTAHLMGKNWFPNTDWDDAVLRRLIQDNEDSPPAV